MTTASTLSRATTALGTNTPARPGPILLATDGTSSSDPAFIATRLLAGRTGQHVHVLTVFDTAPLLAPDAVPVMPLREWDIARAEQMLEEARRQVREQVGESVAWSTDMRLGSPAATIARTARELRATVIVTGLSRHGLVDRMFGGETPRRIAQVADVPVLAVASSFERLPERLLVAVDFESGSIRAALRALELFPNVRSVCLAHVKPKLSPMTAKVARWDVAYEDGIRAAFERVKAQLPSGLEIETMTLTGDPAREIVDFAEYARADLIVAGTHQRGVLRRMLIGSVAAGLLRGAKSAVLLVPPDLAHDIEHPTTQQRTDEGLGWSSDRHQLADRLRGEAVPGVSQSSQDVGRNVKQ